MDLIEKLINNRTKRVSSFIGEIDSEIQKYRNNIRSLEHSLRNAKNDNDRMSQLIETKDKEAEIYKDIAMRFLPSLKPPRAISRICNTCGGDREFIYDPNDNLKYESEARRG